MVISFKMWQIIICSSNFSLNWVILSILHFIFFETLPKEYTTLFTVHSIVDMVRYIYSANQYCNQPAQEPVWQTQQFSKYHILFAKLNLASAGWVSLILQISNTTHLAVRTSSFEQHLDLPGSWNLSCHLQLTQQEEIWKKKKNSTPPPPRRKKNLVKMKKIEVVPN